MLCNVKILMEKEILIIVVCDYGYFKILKFLIKLGVKVDLKKNEKIM